MEFLKWTDVLRELGCKILDIIEGFMLVILYNTTGIIILNDHMDSDRQ